MNSNDKYTIRISISEILFYAFFVLILSPKAMGFYDGQPVFKICLVFATLAWAGKMCLTAYTWREIISVVLLVMLGGVSYLVSGEKGALLYICMVTGLKSVPLKRVFIVGSAVWTILFWGLSWLNAVHILEGPFQVHEKSGFGIVIRWGLGQSHPNVLHISYLVFVMFLVYLMGKKFRIGTAVWLMIGNILLYFYSVSSTGIISVTLYLLFSLYWRYKGKLQVGDKMLIELALPVCVLCSLLAPILLKGKIYDIVNDITNTRLHLSDYFLNLKPPTLFGVRLSEIITSRLTMDNSYVFAFVTYGTVMFALIVCAYIVLVHKYCKEQKGQELCVMVACFVAGIMEPFMFNTSFKNLSLLFMKDLLFEEGKEEPLLLLSGLDRQYEVHAEKIIIKWQRSAFAIYNMRKVLLLSILAGCLVGSISYQLLKQEPQRILAPESLYSVGALQKIADIMPSYYLTSKDDIPQQTDKMFGYVDSETRMIACSGDIVRMEHIRGLICSGVTVGILFAVAAGLVGCHRSFDRKKR